MLISPLKPQTDRHQSISALQTILYISVKMVIKNIQVFMAFRLP